MRSRVRPRRTLAFLSRSPAWPRTGHRPMSSRGTLAMRLASKERRLPTRTNLRGRRRRPAPSRMPAMATAATTSAVEGDTISFAAIASGGAGGPYTYHWEFGDGATGEGATASHAYSEAGTYTPKVTVTDAYGASAEKVLPMVTVRSPSPTIQPASSSPDPTVLMVLGVLVIAASAAVALAILRRRQRRT